MEQWWTDVSSIVDRYRDGSAVGVDPSFVTSRLATQSSARALGMRDFGRVEWQGDALVAVFGRNHLEHMFEFHEGVLFGGHQCVAPRDGRNLRNPAVGLVSV